MKTLDKQNPTLFTIGDILDKNAIKYPDQDALVFVDKGLRYTWHQLRKECDKVAKGFIALGIKKGDHIAVWSTNQPEWVFCQFAAAKIGAVLVTINTEFKDIKQELGYILKQSDAKTLIFIEKFEKIGENKKFTYDYLDMIQKLCPELKNCKPGKLKADKVPKLKNIILISDKKHSGMFNWQVVVEMGSRITNAYLYEKQEQVIPEDLVLIQYTSGTTGIPKGAMLTHNNVLAYNALPGAKNMKLTCYDRVCGPVPFFHCFGSILVNLCCLVVGATIVIPSEYFNAKKTLEAIQKEKCTGLHGVPSMFIAQLEHPDFPRFDLSSLRTGIIAGAPCPVDLMNDIVYKIGAKEITIAYGLTEASPITHQTNPDDSIEKRVSTVGKPIDIIEAKIVPTNVNFWGKILWNMKKLLYTIFPNIFKPVQGEIWVRGPNVMKGYYNEPDVTSQTITPDGWLKTGDRGEIDKHGYYRIRGRIKNMICVGGENVDELELEQFLFNHFSKIIEVGGVQAVGVPHKTLGEVAAICIKIRKGKTLTEKEIWSIYYHEKKVDGKLQKESKIANFKIPRYIKFVESFPLTAANKVNKIALKKMLIKELGLEELAKIKTA